jgi:hypothetical protein
MAITVNTTDTFEQWRVKTNQISSDVDTFVSGNIAAVRADIASNVATINTNIASNVATINTNIASNVATINTNIVGNVATINTNIVGNVATINTNIVGNVNNILANIASPTGNILTGNIRVTGNITTSNLTVNLTSRLLGNVGIGITNPSSNLHVFGTANIAGNIVGTANIAGNFNVVSSSAVPLISVIPSNGSATFAASAYFNSRVEMNSGGAGVVINEAGADSDFRVEGDTDTNLIFVDGGTDRVGIGTGSPSYKLHVVGDIYATGDVTAFSDARHKENIQNISDALSKVLAINGVTFTRKDTEKQRHTGLIAQEVLKVLPEAVHGSEETSYSVAYGNLVGLLVEAIKELNKKVEELSKK